MSVLTEQDLFTFLAGNEAPDSPDCSFCEPEVCTRQATFRVVLDRPCKCNSDTVEVCEQHEPYLRCRQMNCSICGIEILYVRSERILDR